jgi:DNA-binding NarL/FixJ family response regulator
MIRILLADDQQLVRAGLRALLEGESDMEVVGEAGDGDEAVALAREIPADVLIGNVSMSCAEVTSSGLGSRLVISSAAAKGHVLQTMRKLGAHDRAQLVVLANESGLVVPSPMRVRA